jgi:hypothetical protein
MIPRDRPADDARMAGLFLSMDVVAISCIHFSAVGWIATDESITIHGAPLLHLAPALSQENADPVPTGLLAREDLRPPPA